MTEQLTVDAVLTDGTHVLLIERAKDPYKGCLAFPGGRVDPGEALLAAAYRELREETGIEVFEGGLRELMVLDAPGRDPRPGHTDAHVFWAKVSAATLRQAIAASDAVAIHIVPLSGIDPARMAFDHYHAIERLRDVM